jgi:poly-gamma-glutamate capsule biosynthesis protein CapA/YwtB (metallophosphatase superfamily)
MSNDLLTSFRLFFAGDVMTGRGIDQILPHPSKPKLYESFVDDARIYTLLAEKENGKINYPVTFEYIWGDALPVWRRLKPNANIINFETAITRSDDYWPKGINYRMHPENITTLSKANIAVCCLANNHILDFGYEGLKETLTVLDNAGIKSAGAGLSIAQAMQPAVITLANQRRIVICSAGMPSSGIPASWQAAQTPGMYYLANTGNVVLHSIAAQLAPYKAARNFIILSIHWGSNWGYTIPSALRAFAHHLIDVAKVDVLFGHSSHHPRAIEIYHGKPILYGCGDFINDYEGITGYEQYRGELTLMYFLDFDYASETLTKITLVPMRIKNFRLQYANTEESQWLLQLVNRYAIDVRFQLIDKPITAFVSAQVT